MKFVFALLVVAAAQPSKYEACKLINKEIVGANLKVPFKVQHIQNCKEACQSNDDCVAFSFDKTKYLCQLKQQEFMADGITPILKKIRYNEDFTSADANCELTPIDYHAHTECKAYDMLVVGNSVTTKAGNIGACQKLTGTKFLYFSYNDLKGDCVLFSKTKQSDQTSKFPVVLKDAQGWISATSKCDINRLTLTDIMRGKDGVMHRREEDGRVLVKKESNDLKTVKHTVSILNDRVYKSDAPTPAPTTAPTQWYMNPKNYWVPCQVSDWVQWSECTVTCGDAGIQKTQATLTVAHMNPNYRGPTVGIPKEPVCKICTKYSAKAPFKCESYEMQPKRKYLSHTGEDIPDTYWVTRFRPCLGPNNKPMEPCAVDCQWSAWGKWTSIGNGQITRTRTIAVQADHNGHKCEGVKRQTKDWQNTKFSEAGAKFCNARTEDGKWSPCKTAPGVKGSGYSTRVKKEVICNDSGFLKDKAGVAHPAKVVMRYHQTKTCKNAKPVAYYNSIKNRSERPGLTGN